MYNQNKIEGIEISTNNKSKRIIELYLKDDFIKKLIFPFKRFDIMALEYKPFTRFTLAKNLDDLTQNKLCKLINSILKDRNKGCFILKTNNQNKKIDLWLKWGLEGNCSPFPLLRSLRLQLRKKNIE